MELKWLCIANCFLNGRRYRKGQVVLAFENPSAVFFVQTTNDDPVTQAPPARKDLDNTYYYGMKGWEDFKFPVTTSKQGANLKPDYDFTNNGYLFPNNDTAEVLYVSDQLPHSAYLGSGAIGHPHLHLIQAANQQAVFKLKYRFIEPGVAVPAFTTLTSTGYVFPYVSGSMSQILTFPEISLAGLSISSLVDIQLYREDAVYTGDILVKSIDIHIPLDSLGSGQEFSK